MYVCETKRSEFDDCPPLLVRNPRKFDNFMCFIEIVFAKSIKVEVPSHFEILDLENRPTLQHLVMVSASIRFSSGNRTQGSYDCVLDPAQIASKHQVSSHDCWRIHTVSKARKRYLRVVDPHGLGNRGILRNFVANLSQNLNR